MTTIVLTFVFFLLFMTFMAMSLLFKRRPLQKRCAADPLEPCTCAPETDRCFSEGALNQPLAGKQRMC